MSIAVETLFSKAIADILREEPRTRDVHVIVTGDCMSAAVDILLAVPLECRHATPECLFMLHARRQLDGRRDGWTYASDEQFAHMVAKDTFLDDYGVRVVMASGEDCFFGLLTARKYGLVS